MPIAPSRQQLAVTAIHLYYLYLCDMVRGIEHFRVSLRTAQSLEKVVRGATAGFNTPLFIVDTPGGKRDVHSAEFYDLKYGISAFISPTVAPGRLFFYFDPVRSLGRDGCDAWRATPKDELLARVSAIPELMLVN